jgi:hypothetical protein
MPITQKRKCSVSFGELISFLSIQGEDTPPWRTNGSTPRAFTTKGTKVREGDHFSRPDTVFAGRILKEARYAFFENDHFVFYSGGEGGSLE